MTLPRDPAVPAVRVVPAVPTVPAVAPAARQEAARLPPVRRNELLEAVLVCALALAAVFWIIPAQTTAVEAAAGLAPATLPTVSAVAIAVLALMNLLVALVARARAPEPRLISSGTSGTTPTADRADRADMASPIAARAVAAWPALKIMLVSLAGVVALAFGGPAACAVVIVPLGMLVLGERRPWRILPVTLIALAPFVLLFR